MQINESAGTLALTIPQVGGSAAAGVTGQVDIGNANTASISMGAAEYDFGSGNVTLTGNTTFTGATPTVDMINASGDGGDFTITGTLTLNNGLLDVNTKGGNIGITGNITSAGVDEALTLDDGTGTGTITLGGTVSTGDITLIGDSGISLSGDITSNKTGSAGAIAFTGPVTLADTASDSVTIDADQHASTTVTFNSTATVNAAGAGGLSLIHI